MGKEQIKKLTLEDLIAKKEQVLAIKKKTQELEIKSLGGSITIKSATTDIISDAISKGGHEADVYAVYNCVIEPNLKDKKLQDAYECFEPIDIVDKLFSNGDASFIAEQIMKLSGYNTNNITVVDNLKN